jgi:hypothetical protein
MSFDAFSTDDYYLKHNYHIFVLHVHCLSNNITYESVRSRTYVLLSLKLRSKLSFFFSRFFVQQCADIFGPQFTLELLQRGINETNTNYGGYDMKVTNVVFPNGAIDPWHALGITKDLSPKAIALFIQGETYILCVLPLANTPQNL